ncbi:DUF3820 family protein [Imtechella halotolerans]|uniref:Cytoplasmic protein n=1 Tax=Imtechella halotolerans K1 TaxID=946077 RepID=I0WBB1_9FLAO|nr:hypothetical protein W5A_10190 [Imtechella halotolerans K1]
MIDINRKEMIQLSHAQMPFGKFKGRYLIDLPESYLVWFKQQGFPKGTLGKQLEAIYEIKVNGLEELIRTVRKQFPSI